MCTYTSCSLVPRPVSALGVLHHLPERERVWWFAYSESPRNCAWNVCAGNQCPHCTRFLILLRAFVVVHLWLKHFWLRGQTSRPFLVLAGDSIHQELIRVWEQDYTSCKYILLRQHQTKVVRSGTNSLTLQVCCQNFFSPRQCFSKWLLAVQFVHKSMIIFSSGTELTRALM